MAVRVRRYKTDDLIASENPEGPEVEADRTTRFEVDGRAWEIDLSGESRERFRAALAPFQRAARPVSGPGRQRPKAERDRSARIRDWAREQGIKVNERGRIPADVEERYKQEREPEMAST